MRLIFTTTAYEYGGLSRPGLPLVLNDEMQPAEPFQSYLHHRLLGAGRPLDPKTWEAYGRRLWDFIRYLHANGLTWNMQIDDAGEGPVVTYRDWSRMELGLEATTVNSRLAVVINFYEWAFSRGLIGKLPFGYIEKEVKHETILAHLGNEPHVLRKPSVMLTEWDEEPAFSTKDQLRVLLELNHSPTRRILIDLMARVGLRSCEARTFPLKYVFNPAKRVGLKQGQMIEVGLKPRDMEIKYKKPRKVHVPYSLMEEMYAYTAYERNRLKSSKGKECSSLLLTVNGNTFSKDAVVDVCASLSRKVGFKFTPLMLRHSYAIHTLVKLRAQPEFEGEPLLYIRDRLGHSSVETTLVYLRQIERLSGATMIHMQRDFDELFEDVPSEFLERR